MTSRTFVINGQNVVADDPVKHITCLVRQANLPTPKLVPLLASCVCWQGDRCYELRLPDPRTQEGYACCLHEMGHIYHPKGNLRKTGLVSPANFWDSVITEEESAWEWAEQNSLAWTPAMESFKQMCLTTYYEKAKMAAEIRRGPWMEGQ